MAIFNLIELQAEMFERKGEEEFFFSYSVVKVLLSW
jgi:hypothetical protein